MRRLFFLLFVIVFLFVAAPSHAAGQENHAPPDVLALPADTAIWASVVFALLFAILYFKAWPQVLEGLQKREETIRSSLEEAKNVRAEMVTLKADFQQELAAAHQQIPKLMEDARKKAEELSLEMRSKAAAEIQTERDRLRREVEIAKDQAIKELWEQAAQLATLISVKAIGRSLTDDDHRRLLDEAMTELGHAGRN